MPRLALHLLGAPRIERDGVPVEFDRRKAVALLAYLAVTGEGHARDALAALFWPENDHAHARAALRRTLAALNASLGEDWAEAGRDAVRLRAGPDVWVDVAEIAARLGAARAHGHAADTACAACAGPLAEAADLYRGDFLAGFTLRDSPGFDEWQFFQTEALRGEFAGALERLVSWHAGRAEYAAAIAYARRRLALEPAHEPAHARLMQLYAWSGQRAAALRQYRECARSLQQDLGVAPQEETTRLYEAIRDGNAPPAPGAARPPAASARLQRAEAAAPPYEYMTFRPARAKAGLPAEVTPFLGREEELAALAARIEDPDCRLLTLVGPGGIGKTRLAVRAARDNGHLFRNGTAFVPLCAVTSPDSLVPAIAQAVGAVAYGDDEPAKQILAHLRDKQILLVLDNFEHLTGGVGLLAEILAAARGVKILVTSRERLSLAGEWVVEVQGLRYPHPGAEGGLREYSAVQLFVEGARRARADFSLMEEGPAVARICQLVEGMPLGIELAAAWVRMLSCEEIAREIEHSFGFLSSSLRDAPERHRSIRAVFAHSWGLLSEQERRAFRRLSVFRGGFRREAAEAVTGTPLAVLLGLADKSLLRRNAYGRYELHELVRQFAAERLREDPEEHAAARAAHCEHYTSFLARVGAEMTGDNPQAALDEICAEFGNVRGAWRWAVEQGRFADVERSLTSLSSYYDIRGWFVEGDEALREAGEGLARAPAGEPDERRERLLAKLAARRGVFHSNLGRHESALELLTVGLEAARRFGDREEEAHCLTRLAKVAYHIGDHARAMALLSESADAYRAVGDRLGVAKSLNVLGYMLGELGAYAEARRLLEESLETMRALGYRIRAASALNNLGYVLYLLGEHERAKELLQESLAARRVVGHRVGIATTLDNLGYASEALGQHVEAREYFREALRLAVDIQALPVALDVLAGLGTILFKEGRVEQAAELLALVHHHGSTWRETKDRTWGLLSAAAADLPSATFDAAVERGAARRCEEAAREVLDYGFWISDLNVEAASTWEPES